MPEVIFFRSWNIYSILLILIIGPSNIPTPALAKCVWYGECGYATFVGKTLNCPYDGNAKPVDKETRTLLSKWCPAIGKGHINSTCCDVEQARSLDKHLGIAAQLLSRCPSCNFNFLQVICALVCDPDQSSFIEVLKVVETNIGAYGISEINIYLSHLYARKFYASCEGLKGPDGSPALEIMCDRPIVACSPEILFRQIGDVTKFSQFQMNFILTDEAIGVHTPFHRKTFACNEPPTPEEGPCTCQDCKLNCPGSSEFETPKKLYAGQIYLSQLMVILLFMLILSGLIPLLIYYHRWEAAYLAIPPEVRRLDWLSLLFLRIRLRLRRLEEFGAHMEEKMEHGYGRLGKICAASPHIFLSVGCATCIVLSVGIVFIQQTINPIELWAAKTSKTRLDKEYFDNHFGPFYRTEQIIVRPLDMPKLYHNESGTIVEMGPVFNRNILRTVYELQRAVERISANGTTLKELCYAPMSNEFAAENISQCLVMSVWGFYQDDMSAVLDEDYLSRIVLCLSNPFNPSCLARWGGPIYPEIALGGFLSAPTDDLGQPRPELAEVLIITYLLRNHVDEKKQRPAKLWEEEFIEMLKKWKKQHQNPKISFSSESSIENELERSSKADAFIIAISYITMFVYIMIFLGRCSKLRRCMIDGKISLGFFGLLIVLMSVSSSIGFFGYIGIPVTPIIIEVIPFLVLSIGVDNIFILVHAYDRLHDIPGESVVDRTGRMLGLVGPSVTLTSLSECCAFFIGALSTMPAVKAFALYAGMALLIDFLFQMTCFVSLIALDSRRTRGNRYDIFFCIKSSQPRFPDSSWVLLCFRKYYVPAIMHKYVRPAVIIFFVLLSFVSMYTYAEIKLGLRPELSMSKDSYVYEYLQDLDKYLSIGPPLYFVVKDANLDYGKPEIQNLFCSSPKCDNDSLALQIFGASSNEFSYIAKPVSSWLDDFFSWFAADGCCRVRSNHRFCPHYDESCQECEKANATSNRPTHEDFERYIPFFLQDDPDETCAKAGHASYSSGVILKLQGNDSQGYQSYRVGENYYMSYHTLLKTSEDFYRALENAYIIAENVTRTINRKFMAMGLDTTVEVFPYSVFYVFYEQYLTLWRDSVRGILVSFFAIFLTTFILMGLDLWSAMLVVLSIAMILNNMLGMMYFWNIELNAISLVNIVLAIGISVEFCSHITHFFVMTTGTDRIDRASLSLTEMGSSVFAGLTITKLIGITVLAFASSQLFQVFYFRMFFSIVLFGAAHGLIYHPVMLSYLGSDTHIYFVRKSLGLRRRTFEGYIPDDAEVEKKPPDVKPEAEPVQDITLTAAPTAELPVEAKKPEEEEKVPRVSILEQQRESAPEEKVDTEEKPGEAPKTDETRPSKQMEKARKAEEAKQAKKAKLLELAQKKEKAEEARQVKLSEEAERAETERQERIAERMEKARRAEEARQAIRAEELERTEKAKQEKLAKKAERIEREQLARQERLARMAERIEKEEKARQERLAKKIERIVQEEKARHERVLKKAERAEQAEEARRIRLEEKEEREEEEEEVRQQILTEAGEKAEKARQAKLLEAEEKAEKEEEERRLTIAEKQGESRMDPKTQARIAKIAKKTEEAIKAKKEKLALKAKKAEEAERAKQEKLAEKARKTEEAEKAKQEKLPEKSKKREDEKVTETVEEAEKPKESKISEEAEKAEKAKEAKPAEEAEKAKDSKIIEEAEKADKLRESKDPQEGEKVGKTKESKLLEEEGKADEPKQAEMAILGAKAEDAGKVKQDKLLEKARKTEEAEKAKQAKLAEKARKSEEIQKAKEEKLAERARKSEEIQKAKEEKLAERARKSEEAKIAKQAKLAEKAKEGDAAKETKPEEELEKLKESKAPVVAEQPRESKAPGVAEKPRESKAPEGPDKPRESKAPGVAEKPRESKAPDETAKTEEPKQTKVEELAAKPEVTEKTKQGKQAEKARKAEEAEKAKQAKLAEKARKSEEIEKAKQEKLAEKARKSEEAKMTKQAKLAEKTKKVDDVKETKPEEELEKPKESKAPEGAEKPRESKAPGVPEKPRESRAPEGPDKPRESRAPGVAEKPRESKAPDETAKAEEAKQTKVEELAAKPEVTEKAKQGKPAEKARKSEEIQKAKEEKLAEKARKSEEIQKAKEEKLAEKARKSEEIQRAKEEKLAERARKSEEAKIAKQAKVTEKTKKVDDVKETKPEEELEKPKESKAPEGAEKPRESKAPGVPEKPRESKAPEGAEKPRESKAPEGPDKPRESKAPGGPEKPRESKASGGPEKPRESKAPDETAKAEEPKQTKVEELAAKPEVTEKAKQGKLAEKARKAEEAEKAKQAKLAEKAKKAEEAEKAKQEKLAEKARKSEEAEKAKQAKLAEKTKKVDDVKESKTAEEGEKPRESKAPEGTEKPRESKAPEGAEKPRESRAPGGPEKPRESKAPEGPEKPRESRAPGGPEKPRESKALEGAEKPRESKAPDGVDKPRESKAPGGPEKPRESKAPEGVDKPRESKAPEGVDKPRESKGPVDAAKTEKPRDSKGPEPAEKPEEAKAGKIPDKAEKGKKDKQSEKARKAEEAEKAKQEKLAEKARKAEEAEKAKQAKMAEKSEKAEKAKQGKDAKTSGEEEKTEEKKKVKRVRIVEDEDKAEKSD